MFASRLKIWLSDSVGHAAGLLMDEVLMFKEKFNKLVIKASEVKMMIPKINLKNGSLLMPAEETMEWMEAFICLLERIKEARMLCKVMGYGALSPLIPDYFIREHVYFISKIKEYMA